MRRSARLLLYYPNYTFIGVDRKPVQYQWLPRRLLLVRHGESEANVNREVYSNKPDWRIELTERGRDQAFDCGRRLRRIIGNEKIYIYYSPYTRTRQTLEEIRKSLDESQIQGEREDERLREQEMGNYQPMSEMDSTWAARNRFSRLYYRFPFGESSADVGDRVSSFFDSLLRERIGLTVPNMNESMMSDASEEVAWLGLGRWKGRLGGDPGTGTPVRAGAFAAPAPGPSSASPSRTGTHAVRSPLSSGAPPRSGESASAAAAAAAATGDRGRQHHGTISSLNGLSSESGRDVSDRAFGDGRPVSELAAAMERGVLPPNDLGAAAGDDQNVVIVAHGLLIRLFIGRWFRVPMEVFETMCNPPNCSIVVLKRDDDLGRLVMTDISKQLFGSDPLLQMMRFDGREDTQWYRERFLGIIDPERDAQRSMQTEDDDENHYSRSKTPHEYEPPANLRDDPPVQRPRPGVLTASPPPPAAPLVSEGEHGAAPPGNAAAGAASQTLGDTRGPRRSPAPRAPNAEPVLHSKSGYDPPSPPRPVKGSSHEWDVDLWGEGMPNIGPSEDTTEMKMNLKKYLSRGFW